MYKNLLRFFTFIFFISFSFLPLSFAEMSSNNFSISVSVMNSAGTSKSSDNFNLLDAVGQPTPTGPSDSANFSLKAGFIYGTTFTMPLDETITGVIGGLEDILTDPSLARQEKKKIELAIKFLEDALEAWAFYEAGDSAALANALNKTKSAINKLIDSGVDTDIYQEMLAQASELAVTTEINNIASTAGDSDPKLFRPEFSCLMAPQSC